MPFIPIILVAVLALLLLVGSAYAQAKSEKTPSVMRVRIVNSFGLTADQVGTMSGQELNAALEKMEKDTSPLPRPMIATCYYPASPPSSAEYVCPTCGEKTVYSKTEAAFFTWQLPDCRRTIEKLSQVPGAFLRLEEYGYCQKCFPATPVCDLRLLAPYDNGTTHTFSHVSGSDLDLVYLFFKSKSSPNSLSAEERLSLRENLPRVRKVLGLKPTDLKRKP